MTHRVLAPRTRVAFPASILTLALTLASSIATLSGVAPLSTARSVVTADPGLAFLTDERVHLERGPSKRFDFAHVSSAPCKKTYKDKPLTTPGARERRNVILLSIDTMRRDALGKRIAGRAVTPNLEAFARESVFFARATSAVPVTLYSVGSAFSGRSINQILYAPRPPKSIFSLTRRRLPGQRAHLPNWGFISGNGFRKLVTQGVPASYLPRDTDNSARFITALEKARSRSQRGLFWLHVVEPHRLYKKHAGFDFGDSESERYYGEVAFDDSIVGHVLDYLRKSSYWHDSLIIFFSDHGEGLGEKTGYYGHGVSLAGRFGDVPLIVHYPGVTPRTSNAAVSLTSIARTVLHFLDLPIPGAITDCSLLAPEAELARCPHPISIVYGFGSEIFDKVLRSPIRDRAGLEARQRELATWQRFASELAAVSDTHRYLLNLVNGTEQLYDRVRDPNEEHDLAADEPELLDAFREEVAEYRKSEAKRVVCQLEE